MELSGWGRFPVVDCKMAFPRDEAGLWRALQDGPAIARGNGRAYGDSALNRDCTEEMSGFDRMLAFDAGSGILTVEAGVLLGDIIEAFLPRGWFPSVTPGTKFVSVGGMIAADVHGKNHHKHGSFGSFVEWLDLMDAEGTVRRCSRAENRDLFERTIGGMGLTGIVLRAAIRLTAVESAWIRQETVPAACLDEAIEVFERSADWTYSVAWIDCLARGKALGRSLIMLGEHARRAELDDRGIEAAGGEPSAQRRSRALRPRPELRERHFLVVVELVGRERDRRLVRDDDVVREDHLIQALERIHADRAGEAPCKAELLGDLAQDGDLGMLAALEEARDEAVPPGGSPDAVHEHHAVRTLHDGRDDRHRVAPMHEAALGAREARLAAALDGRELGAAVRAVAIVRVRHD